MLQCPALWPYASGPLHTPPPAATSQQQHKAHTKLSRTKRTWLNLDSSTLRAVQVGGTTFTASMQQASTPHEDQQKFNRAVTNIARTATVKSVNTTPCCPMVTCVKGVVCSGTTAPQGTHVCTLLAGTTGCSALITEQCSATYHTVQPLFQNAHPSGIAA